MQSITMRSRTGRALGLIGAGVTSLAVAGSVSTAAPAARAVEPASAGIAETSPAAMAAAETVPVTLENLYGQERFWPYQVALASDWKPAGHDGEFGWGAGTLGVLLRVDERNRLRIDFGRFGIRWVPADATDVVDRANQVRRGGIQKLGPNLAVALNHRLLDPAGTTLVLYGDDLFLVPKKAYLLVFADPSDSRFAEIARETAEWAQIPGAVLVLVAPKEHPDAHVYKYCHDARWKGTFLMNMFSGPYADAYLEPGTVTPVVQVMTPEGRLLVESAWSSGFSPGVTQAAVAAAMGSDEASRPVLKP